jgi:hypothetical protein
MPCTNCSCYCCSRKKETYPAYRLLKDIPGCEAGTVFLYDRQDSIKGSIGLGCLKNAWIKGGVQGRFCAETHVFPGQMKDDHEWFQSMDNDGSYHF